MIAPRKESLDKLKVILQNRLGYILSNEELIAAYNRLMAFAQILIEMDGEKNGDK